MSKQRKDQAPRTTPLGYEMPPFINGQGSVQGFTQDSNQGITLFPGNTLRYSRTRVTGVYIAFAIAEQLRPALNVPLNPSRTIPDHSQRVIRGIARNPYFELKEDLGTVLELTDSEGKPVNLYFKDKRLTIVVDAAIDANPLDDAAITPILIDDVLSEVAHPKVSEFSRPISQVFAGAIRWAKDQSIY